ncbi:MAG: hypothetical protein K9N21_00560 [Deltaproteobacteria bacterium]|nr:hypothetical protein [Deltaproteobacteria bacterium]
MTSLSRGSTFAFRPMSHFSKSSNVFTPFFKISLYAIEDSPLYSLGTGSLGPGGKMSLAKGVAPVSSFTTRLIDVPAVFLRFMSKNQQIRHDAFSLTALGKNGAFGAVKAPNPLGA